MKIEVKINRSYLEGSQPKELEVEEVKLSKSELNLQYVELYKAKEFLSSFTLNCRSHILVERDASIVYSMQIPLKYIDTVHFI